MILRCSLSPLLVGILAFLPCSLTKAVGGISIEITRDGEALVPIIVAPNLSPEAKRLVEEFKQNLERVTGGHFTVETAGAGVATNGIVLGTATDWPDLIPPLPEGRAPSHGRDDYLLRSEAGRVLLIGRTDLGLQNAIWDFFHQIGFRQFMPGPRWEIWPKAKSLAVQFNLIESPDYFTRTLALGGSFLAEWKAHGEHFEQWKIRNRMVSGFQLQTGHVYQRIIQNNRELFARHPEGVILPEGTPPSILESSEPLNGNLKLDPSQASVLEIVAQDALRRALTPREKDCISMEPSDGLGWRDDSPLGSPSNQAVALANHTANVLRGDFPDTRIGMYAYGVHSPPPDIAVDPAIIISVATGFINGGWTVPGLMKAWSEKGVVDLGIREYFSVWPWDHSQPGASRGSDLAYVSKTISEFHGLGAKYWVCEGSKAWAPNGLGYYLASRFLWNVGDIAKQGELLDDFYTRSFEEAAPEMREFFTRYLLAEGRPMLSSDLIGRMYRTLEKAMAKSPSEETVQRIGDFVVYTHFLERWLAYQGSEGEARREAFDEMARFVYRSRDAQMLDSLAIFRFSSADRKLEGVEGILHGAEGQNPLKPPTPIASTEIRELVRNGIANNKLNDFETVAFSSELLPSGEVPDDRAEPKPINVRGVTQLMLHANEAGKTWEFAVEGALYYSNRGPVKIKLFADENPIINEPVISLEVAADKTPHPVHLRSPFKGVHRLEISDSRAGVKLSWPHDQAVAFPVASGNTAEIHGRYTMSFYVPEGTKVIGGYSERPHGKIRFPDGSIALNFEEMLEAGYFSIKVPEGMGGAFWKLEMALGKKQLLTIPAYLARSPAELLIPKEAMTVAQ